MVVRVRRMRIMGVGVFRVLRRIVFGLPGGGRSGLLMIRGLRMGLVGGTLIGDAVACRARGRTVLIGGRGLLTEKVVYEAEVPRFVVQALHVRHHVNGVESTSWEDYSGHRTLEAAKDDADALASERPYWSFRVVERE